MYRAFLDPGVHGWPDHGCVGCSMVADQVAHVAHLHHRNTSLAFASRGPQADIQRIKARMGWEMPWYTITDGFDVDFGVDEWHGTNAFIRDGDRVFRTYFINSRGDEAMGSTWSYLDMTALGRQETWEDSPEGYPQDPPYSWWTWHDEAPKPGEDAPGLVQLRIAESTGGVVVVTGHVSGLPVEELLPTLLSGGGAWVILRLTSLGTRRRSTRHDATTRRTPLTRLATGRVERRRVAGEGDPHERGFVHEAVERPGRSRGSTRSPARRTLGCARRGR